MKPLPPADKFVGDPGSAEPKPQPQPQPALSLEMCVGAAVRAQRLRQRLKLSEIAETAGISVGMLSKIENGQITAGLETLSRVARALGCPMALLFRTYDVPAGDAHLVKRGEGMPFIRQGNRPGHTFQMLSFDQGPTKAFDAFLVTIELPTDNPPAIEHPGTELIHVIEGVMEYRSGQSLYRLEPGDTLTLRGEILHGFERLIELPVRFLSVIVYSGAT